MAWAFGFSSRIVVASSLVSVLLLPPALLVSLHTLVGRIVEVQVRSTAQLRTSDIERCRRAPERWQPPSSVVSKITALDAARVEAEGHALLSDALLQSLRSGLEIAVDDPFFSAGGQAYKRVGQGGPCSLFLFRWRAPAEMPASVILVAITAAAIVLGIALSFATIFAIRPLLARLERVREAAMRVGEPGYGGVDDDHGDAISEIAGALDRAQKRIMADAAELDARSTALEDHLADVAHDLRTPVAALQMSIERAHTAGEQSLAQAELLPGALRDITYIASLVANLRLGTQLDHGQSRVGAQARLNLSELVDTLELRFAVLAEAHNVLIAGARPDEPVHTVCEPLMAQQAIANLVDNALRHGAARGAAERGVEGNVAIVLEAEPDSFCLRVIDDGPGLTDVGLQAIRTGVAKKDPPKRNRGGSSGLGLSISWRVCQMAGWSIDLDHHEDSGGLCVTIRGARVLADE